MREITMVLINYPTSAQQSRITIQPDAIRAWGAQARNYPQGSRERNYYLTQIIRAVSPKLWKVNTPYYPDALQQTWTYFVKNVCTTYDPERGSISTWLNVYLRYRHQDLLQDAIAQDKRTIPIDASQTATAAFALKEVPSKEYGSLALLEEAIAWVKADPDGRLRCTHLRERSDVNCQTLLLLRLPSNTPWKEISVTFNIPIPTLSAFFQRRCLPHLYEFGRSAGICHAPTNEPYPLKRRIV
jgi:hypothetical protein